MRRAWTRTGRTSCNSLVNCTRQESIVAGTLRELEEHSWEKSELFEFFLYVTNNGLKCWTDAMLFTFLEVNSRPTYMLLFPNEAFELEF